MKMDTHHIQRCKKAKVDRDGGEERDLEMLHSFSFSRPRLTLLSLYMRARTAKKER